MKTLRLVTAVALFALVLAACQRADVPAEPLGELEAASAATVFEARLLPENEVHEVDSDASGQATAVLQGNTLRVRGSFQGLVSDLIPIAGTPGHIHEAPVGMNGPIVFLLDVTSPNKRSGSFSLTTTLTDEQVDDLLAGRYYINLHTQEHPAGELRGQLFPRQRPAVIRTELSGEQEVHGVDTSATGTARATLANFNLSVTGRFSGLEGDLLPIAGSPAHIHQAPRGENGPIVFNLEVMSSNQREGTFRLTTKLDDAQRAAFRDGLFYVNIHTEAFPMGELRGQLD